MKTIAFIILNYNVAETTIELVDKLCNFSGDRFNSRIIVVDNCSPNGSAAVLRERYVNENMVDIIVSDHNGGYSYGNNFGARYAIKNYQPEYLAIANPDIWVDENTVASLLETFKEDENLSMCAPVMKDVEGNYRISSSKLPEFRDDLKACFAEKPPKAGASYNFEYLNGKKNMIITECVPGSFFVIRTDIFEKIGMLDEGVFLFGEERMLGHRIKSYGYKVVLRADLFFVHAHSPSVNKAYKMLQIRKMILNSRLYYECKYNHINKKQELILKCAHNISLVYLRLKLFIRSIIKNTIKKELLRQ